MTHAHAPVRLDTLQYLRGIAALAVVLFHFGDVLRNAYGWGFNPFMFGASGVDVFFVLSGFVMCHASHGKEVHPGTFMVDRLARIAPLYWLLTMALVAVAIVAPSVLSSTRLDWSHVAQSLAFVPYLNDAGYWRAFLFPGWTLNYEMAFYAVFALSLWLCPRAPIAMVLAIITGVALYGYVVQPDGVLAFYTRGIVLEFAAGCVLFLAWKRWPHAFRNLAPLAVGAAGLLVVQGFSPVALPAELVAGVPAVLLVAGVLSLPTRKGVSGRAMKALGDWSYSLYLVHAYVMVVVTKLSVAVLGTGVVSASACAVLSVAGSIVAAGLLYRFVEAPLNTWRKAIKTAPKKVQIAC